MENEKTVKDITRVESPTELLSHMKIGEVQFAPNIQRDSFEKTKSRLNDRNGLMFAFKRVKGEKHFSIVRTK